MKSWNHNTSSWCCCRIDPSLHSKRGPPRRTIWSLGSGRLLHTLGSTSRPHQRNAQGDNPMIGNSFALSCKSPLRRAPDRTAKPNSTRHRGVYTPPVCPRTASSGSTSRWHLDRSRERTSDSTRRWQERSQESPQVLHSSCPRRDNKCSRTAFGGGGTSSLPPRPAAPRRRQAPSCVVV